jgi:hypothetical protein
MMFLSLFSVSDGMIISAIELGAVIVCDSFKFEEGITYIQVLDTNRHWLLWG